MFLRRNRKCEEPDVQNLGMRLPGGGGGGAGM